jgi:hypothetical protein
MMFYQRVSDFFANEGDFSENLAYMQAEAEQEHWEQDPAYVGLYFDLDSDDDNLEF